MKASEVLRRYQAGERNFQRVNVRGQSFMGEDLSEADFSEADIRSTNFSEANLRGAKFCGAKCGLQKRWATLLVVFAWMLAAISGLGSFLVGFLVSLIVNFSYFASNQIEYQIAGWVSLLILVTSGNIILRQGIRAGAIAVAVAFAVAIVGLVARVVTKVGTVAGLGIVIGTGGMVGLGTVIVTEAVGVAVAFAVAGIVPVISTVGVAVAVAIAGAKLVAGTKVVAGVVAGIVAVGVTVVVGYIGWRAVKGDRRDTWMRSFAIAFATIGGTSFRGADLMEANFTGAKLKSTDLRKAILTRVRWYRAKMLERVRSGDNYLQDSQVRQWLIGEGKEKNFERQSLRGISLEGANLEEASFIGADLSEANLQDADLSRAKLVQTQLDGTNLTGATLTGAFIEDWGITSSTILKEIRCKYVFMRLPPEKRPSWLELPGEESVDPKPWRKPDNWAEYFEEGDFADFIKPIVQTLDLYHNQGVDPRAIAISFKQLAENNADAEIEIVAMERRGEDKFLLRAKTAPEADKSELSREYFRNYNQYKGLSESKLRGLLIEQTVRVEEKRRAIARLESMVETTLKRPSFYAENYQGETNMAGEQRKIEIDKGNYNERIEGDYIERNKTDQSRKIEITGGTVNASGANAFGLGNIYGTVANTINELPFSSNPNEAGIKELLNQLKESLDAPDLSEDDKEQTLVQLKVLAEAGKNPKDASRQKKAERAVSLLEVIAKGVEPATKLAQVCRQVLPKILAFFGL